MMVPIFVACANYNVRNDSNEKTRDLDHEITIKNVKSKVLKDSSIFKTLWESDKRPESSEKILKQELITNWDIPNEFSGRDLENNGYNILNKNDDLSTLSLIKSKCYTIKYSDLMSWDEATPIENILTFEENKMTAFAIKGDAVYLSIKYDYINSTWKSNRIGPVFTAFSNLFYKLLVDKKKTFITIYTEDSDEKNTYKRIHYVFKENDSLMCVTPFEIVSLGKLLSEYQKNIKMGIIF